MKDIDATLEKMKRVQNLLQKQGLVSREEAIRLKVHQPSSTDEFTSRVTRARLPEGELDETKQAPDTDVEKGHSVVRTEPDTVTAEELQLQQVMREIAEDHLVHLSIKISDDDLHAWLSAECLGVRVNQSPMSLKTLRNVLRMHDVKAGIDDQKLTQLIQRIQKGRSFQMELVAEGKPPVTGKSSIVNLYFEQNESVLVSDADADEEEQEEAADAARLADQEKVDFREMVKISMAREGQLLAESFPAEEGEDGFTVRGRALPQPEIERRRVMPGRNTHVNAQHGIVADVDGRIRFDGKILSVNPVYRLTGNVGFRHGNIHFNGEVKVMGEVHSGFKVEGGKDVTVTQSVENAQVRSGGNLTIGGAFIGGERGCLLSERNCSLSHANGGLIEVRGNLSFRRELLNCRVSVWGRVEARKNASIIGGELYIRGNADLFHLGSPAGSLTMVHMGGPSFIYPRIKELNGLIQGLEQNIALVQTSLMGLAEVDLDETDRVSLGEDLQRSLQDLQQEKTALEEEVQTLRKQVYQCKPAFLRIHGAIWPGVKVIFGSSTLDVKNPLKQVEFYLDPKDGKTIRWRQLKP